MNRQIRKFEFRLAGRLAGIGLLLAFVLGACGGAPTAAAPPTEDVRPAINTAVAASITARVTKVSLPTATSSPTVTPTPSRTPTRGATATPTSTLWRGPSTCADSAFIKDVTIPDGTVLAPGEVFVKTWRFKNVGGCDWNTRYSLAFVKGEDMDGSGTFLAQSVKVNRNADISLVLTAPFKEGTYTGYWRLQDNYGYFFGDLVYVQIVVANGTISITTTPDLIPTSVPPGP